MFKKFYKCLAFPLAFLVLAFEENPVFTDTKRSGFRLSDIFPRIYVVDLPVTTAQKDSRVCGS